MPLYYLARHLANISIEIKNTEPSIKDVRKNSHGNIVGATNVSLSS